jgi:hypothetical protein
MLPAKEGEGVYGGVGMRRELKNFKKSEEKNPLSKVHLFLPSWLLPKFLNENVTQVVHKRYYGVI